MMETLTRTQTFEGIVCCRCDLKFFVPSEWRAKCADDENLWWYCPNGHRQHYPGKSDEQKQRERAQFAEQRARRVEEERDSLKYSVRAQKAAKTRLKNRIKNGICPCCNRSFANLKRHMDGQHPDYAETKGGRR